MISGISTYGIIRVIQKFTWTFKIPKNYVKINFNSLKLYNLNSKLLKEYLYL
jgi:hypothetical protein